VGLMRQGAHVVMACRNMTACSEVQQRLSSQIPQGTCSCQRIELDKFDTVRAFAAALRQQLRKEGRSLKVLVNNAGGPAVGRGSLVCMNNCKGCMLRSCACWWACCRRQLLA
jgi:NAD(P)-dependent dehydrogenase (short-subunit alcohol dehydrogenase family)